mmetsp:Transcript_11359/g.27754  ORF Transcript_11359/g.27754 Transcript_11359/m.27754 type:complete len:224 (-) Transcript_11359:346-1017(-)|eukprot:g10832.t1
MASTSAMKSAKKGTNVKRKPAPRGRSGRTPGARTGGDPSVLKLTLNHQPFEAMISGEKKIEYRTFKEHWVRQFVAATDRAAGKTHKYKKFARVSFRNGYAADAPYFEAVFKGIRKVSQPISKQFSNGLRVKMAKGPKFLIDLGPVIKSTIRHYDPRLSYTENKMRARRTQGAPKKNAVKKQAFRDGKKPTASVKKHSSSMKKLRPSTKKKGRTSSPRRGGGAR